MMMTTDDDSVNGDDNENDNDYDDAMTIAMTMIQIGTLVHNGWQYIS